MKRRSSTIGLLLAAAAMILASCSTGNGVPALGREAQPADAWPGTAEQLEGRDPESVRHLVSHEGAEYYVLATADQRGTCIYKFAGDGGSAYGVGGCGDGGTHDVIVTVSAPQTDMSFVRADADTSDLEADGWNRVHENLLLR